MKILANLPALMKVAADVRKYNGHKKKIEAAKAAGDFEEERRWILDATSSFGPAIMNDLKCDLHVHGEENIPESGPVVIVSNHQSYTDIPALFAVFTKFQFGYIAKEYIAKFPLIGEWLPRIRSVFIKNDDPREALKAINRGIDYVNDGFSMAIFPEGTRSKGGDVAEFMRGALKLATRPGVPVVPVAIQGTYRLFEETGVAKAARVDIKIFPPVPTEGMDRKTEKELASNLEEMIREGVKELRNLQSSC